MDMQQINAIVNEIDSFVWGPVMLVLLVGTGVFLTFKLNFRTWRNLPYSIKSVIGKDARQKKAGGEGDVSSFNALMTALSATIGTGNIVGVATAMFAGGPGALVWMWLSAAFGITTKYAECMLASKYREVNEKGEMKGGPMFTMKNGFSNKQLGAILGFLFALFTVLASFGIGNMTQANSISSAFESSFGWPGWVTGIILVIFSLMVLMRGVHSIGKVSSFIVPSMAFFYILFTVIIVIVNFENVPGGLAIMLQMAFSTEAVAGGVGGSIVASMLTAMRWGVARGVFSNEAGLGSAPIAAAAARTDHASRQGYVNMTGTFFDTMIICFLTGLVIASSGMLGSVDPETGKLISGAPLTILAFSTVYGEGAKYIVSIALALFAYSTILGWEYYGEKSLEYLVSNRAVIIGYRIVFSLITFIGATQTLDVVWNFSDTMNGLMAIPNLICLIVLNKDIAKECFDYQKNFIAKGR